MKKRQGIQDLQARLASRLANKDQSGALAAWLAVEAGGGQYLLPLGQAGELFNPTSLVQVPYVKHWFLGLVNLRGALYGVVDLARLPWFGSSHKSTAWLQTPQSRLIVLPSAGETLCALAVDKVLGLKTSQGFQLLRTENAANSDVGLRKLIDGDGKQWLEIDLSKLSSSPEFLDIHKRPVYAEL